MPKGAKKRAKLKKKQQQGGGGHPDDAAHHNGSCSDNNNGTAAGRRDHNLRIPTKPSHADASEDSMESSEEMVTPRAAGSEADEDVRVERKEGDAEEEEEVMVDALPPETSGQADAPEVEVQEPEVKDVAVSEAPAVQEEQEVADAPAVEESEVKREVAKVHPVHEPEEPKAEETLPAVQEPEVKGGNVAVKDASDVSRSRDVDVHATEETARGPAVAVAASAHRAKWWNCCGIFDAFSGSER